MKSYSTIALASIAALTSASDLLELRDNMVVESVESLAASNELIKALVDKIATLSTAMDQLRQDYDILNREQVVDDHFYVNEQKIDIN